MSPEGKTSSPGPGAGSGLRLRRTVSTSKHEEVAEEEKRAREREPDKPCHYPQDSLFTSTSGYTNFSGFFNLCIILLVMSNARVALENIIKYGILVDPVSYVAIFLQEPYHWPACTLILLANVFILAAFTLERLVHKEALSERTTRALHVINLMLLLTFPAAVILIRHINPAGANFALGIYTVVFLKLVSYVSVNKWCRVALKHRLLSRRKSMDHSRTMQKIDEDNSMGPSYVSEKTVYPDNLTLPNIYYFMLVPTLCYELNFPRSPRIRKWFLCKRFAEMIMLFHVMLALVQQWIIPTVNNSMKPFHEMDVSRTIERLLKLAIPNHLIWLIFFYWMFHSCLNVVAELTRFADRKFYRDWWNAESVQYFWQAWNIPVHKWALRHIYRPMLQRGYTKFQASFMVFLASAFFHEYLVSIPLNMFKTWAFLGMILQVPFAFLVAVLFKNKGKFANMAVWVSLIVGQPAAILMYVHDYYVMHYGASHN